jgi:hypothetical protein
MKYRKLRIAWSVMWGIAAALLIALWVRSHWTADRLCYPAPLKDFQGSSMLGVITLDFTQKTPTPFPVLWQPQVMSPDFVRVNSDFMCTWFLTLGSYGNYQATFPHWFAAALCPIVSSACWIRWRFTTRNMLIATAGFSVILGWLYYVADK